MVIQHRIEKSTSAVTVNYNRMMHTTWVYALCKQLLTSPYMDSLQCYINELYKATDHVFPRNKDDIFRAFELISEMKVKVVIFGNEPYQSVNSNGLAFGSFKSGRGLNPVMQTRKIQDCLFSNDSQKYDEFDTTLRHWAKQGVFLLNTSLVSELGEHMKHEIIFRNFIREVVKVLSDDGMEIVFVFTSREQAEKYEKYIDTTFHTVLKYDGIEQDSSMFEDINQVLQEEKGTGNSIVW